MTSAPNEFTVHTDGGSRGNPGPAAAGFVIEGPGIGRVEHGERLGETTNNIAEYTAVVLALRKLKALLGTEGAKRAVVHVYADSELLVRQLNGQYKVKDADLKVIFMELWNARLDFSRITFTHIPREKNQAADRMVNEALDAVTAPGLGL
jgi:ribonuclease HI